MSATIDNQTVFDDALSSNEWVLIDFWATWCGPCKSMTPVFDAVAQERKQELFAAKVNVDEFGKLANSFAVRGVPTLSLLHRGRPVSQLVGAQPKSVVDSWLDEQLRCRAS